MRAIELTKLKGVVKAKSSLLLEGGSASIGVPNALQCPLILSVNSNSLMMMKCQYISLGEDD